MDITALRAELEGFKRLMDERDRRYSETNAAAKEALSAAFRASEMATAKAEDAQTKSNEKNNEFRGQLADQAANLMPRKETEALIAQVNTELKMLRESNAQGSGRAEQKRDTRDTSQWEIGLIVIVLAAILTGAIELIIRFVAK